MWGNVNSSVDLPGLLSGHASSSRQLSPSLLSQWRLPAQCCDKQGWSCSGFSKEPASRKDCTLPEKCNISPSFWQLIESRNYLLGPSWCLLRLNWKAYTVSLNAKWEVYRRLLRLIQYNRKDRLTFLPSQLLDTNDRQDALFLLQHLFTRFHGGINDMLLFPPRLLFHSNCSLVNKNASVFGLINTCLVGGSSQSALKISGFPNWDLRGRRRTAA